MQEGETETQSRCVTYASTLFLITNCKYAADSLNQYIFRRYEYVVLMGL